MQDFLAIIGGEEHKRGFLCMVFRARHVLRGKDGWNYLIFRKKRLAWDEIRALGHTEWIKPDAPKHFGCLVLDGEVPAQKLIETLLRFFPTVYFRNNQTNFVEVAHSKTVLPKRNLNPILDDLRVIAARLYTVGRGDLTPQEIRRQNAVKSFDPTVFADIHRELNLGYEEWVRMKKAHGYVLNSTAVTAEIARELGRPMEWLITGGMKGMAGNYLKAVKAVQQRYNDLQEE